MTRTSLVVSVLTLALAIVLLPVAGCRKSVAPATVFEVKVGGGHSGHNGVKSVNAHVGSPEYCRVRVGVGRPPPRMDPAANDHGRFSKGEEDKVEECVAWATEAARLAAEQGATKAMNAFNRRDAGKSAK